MRRRAFSILLISLSVLFMGCFGGESTVDEDYHPGIPVLSAASLIFSEGATGELYDFGKRLSDVNYELSLTVSNEGQSKALELSADALSAGFQFKGGSYPGTGGSCGTELEGGSTCKLVVVFSSTTSGTYSSTLTLHYKNGKQTNPNKILSLSLSGETHKVGEISFESTSSTAVRVTWTAVSSNPTADTFEYKLVKSTSLSDIDTVTEANNIANPEMDWAKATSATVSSLTPGTTYYFAVLVRDSDGNKVLYTPKSTSTTLLAPTGVGATAGSGQNSISWSSSTGATSYNIYYKTSSGVTTADTKITGVTSPYTHSSLSGANTYYYVVTAVNASGESSISSEVSAQPKPAAPGGVSATAGSSQNSISWSAVAGATSYNIYYKTSSGVTTSDTQITGVTSTYAHTSLSAANTYYYVVTAVNASGESSISSEVSAKPKPSAPTGVSATAGTLQSTITWSTSTGATSYNIYYNTTGSVSTSSTQISNVTSPYTHSSLSAGNTYYYVVTAVNASGESSISSEVSAAIASTTWAQEAYIKAPNAQATDNFGVGIAVSGDTLVVGADGEDSNQTTITNGTTASSDNSASNAGAVYVFKRTGTTWAQEAYIKAPNADGSDFFGKSVSVSSDTIVVGATGESSSQTTITNGTTASANNTVSASGAAYVFKRSGTTWAQEAYLKAPNAGISDSFGTSISISNDTVVVGAPSEDSNQTTITNGTTASSDNSLSASGAAYVFKRTGTTWAQEAYIKAANADASDQFGAGVSISNDTIVVGSGDCSNQTTITNGTTASSDNSANAAGAVYVYKREGSTWTQEAYIKAPNAENSDVLGYSLSVSGDTIVAGAILEDSNQTTITNGTTASSNNSASTSGAAYVFKRTGTTWAQEAYIKASNSEVGDFFGYSVSISGDTVVVGANQEDSNQTTITNGTTSSSNNSTLESGAVYVYKRSGTTWAQEAYIKAPNADTSDEFGRSVSISEDTIVVGSFDDSNQTTITNGTTASSNNSVMNSGAVYVFKRTQLAPTWSQQAYLKAPNAGGSDYFGSSVSLSNDTAIVGAYQEDSNQTTITNGTTASSDNSASDSGAAYIFKRTGTTWAQEAYIKAPNAQSGDNFGYSVSVSDDTAIVGAFGEDSNQTMITNGTTASNDNSAVGSGAAYIFKRTGTTWAQEAYLKAPNAESGDVFGVSVSVSDDTAIVGAYHDDSNQTTITNGTTASSDNSATDPGSAYIFKRAGTTWAQEAYLKAPNADNSDVFGARVSISNDTAIVGATGESSNQTTITNGTTASSDNSASLSGAAYIFKRAGTTWAQEAYLKAPNADNSDLFGISVSISNDTVIVGAHLEDSNQTTITNATTASSDNSAGGSGAAYIFKRAGTTWAQEAYLKAPNAESGDSFGWSASLSNDTAVVGANQEASNQTTITNGTTASSDNSSIASGAAYVFKRTGTAWAQEAYLKAPNADSFDRFGWSVSVSKDTIIVGAYQEDSNQTTITNGTTASSNNGTTDSGAAYIFVRQ